MNIKEKKIHVIGNYSPKYVQYRYDDFDTDNIIIEKDYYTNSIFCPYDYKTALEITKKNGLESDCIFMMIKISTVKSSETPNEIVTLDDFTYYSTIDIEEFISYLNKISPDTRDNIIQYICDLIKDKTNWYQGIISDSRIDFILKCTLETAQ